MNQNPKFAHATDQSEEPMGKSKLTEIQKKAMHEGLLQEAHWMMKLLPGRIDMEKMKYQLEIFKINAESDYNLLKMHREAMKQSFKEALETMLMNGKVKMRKDRNVFFVEKANELELTICQARDKFGESMEVRYEKLGGYKNELLAKQESLAIDRSILLFYQSLETMLIEFHQIVEEGV